MSTYPRLPLDAAEREAESYFTLSRDAHDYCRTLDDDYHCCTRKPGHALPHVCAGYNSKRQVVEIRARWPSISGQPAAPVEPTAPESAEPVACYCAVPHLFDGVCPLHGASPPPVAAPSHPQPDATGAEDGAVGRFLAFAACQRDDEDRAICDAFYRAFTRACEQIDDTQRRLQATEDARKPSRAEKADKKAAADLRRHVEGR